MIRIYHNPKCSKSREGLGIIEESGMDFEVVNYMNEPISEEELSSIINLLKIKPMDLVRKNEAIWKEKYQSKKLSGKKLIRVLAKNPQLIERPIVINGSKAVIGRPPVLIKDIL